ncbi:MAG: ABC transporter permease [Armatimonadetes bacterium]|nr:ABC transporter permease [Armatimonadota bacterium]
MGAYIARRLAHAIFVLIGVSIVVFIVLRVIPGDPISLMFPEGLSPERLRQARAELGLDAPLYKQYAIFLAHAVRGNLGNSFRYQRPALDLVLERLPVTGQLAVAALVITMAVGIPLGVLAAARRGGLLDVLTMFMASVGQSMPTFWLGIMLIVIFAVALRWFPTSGRESPVHLVLPAVTLSGFSIALTSRLTRAAIREVLAEDYVRTARAKGVHERAVLVRHVLRNGIIPVVTVLGLQVGALLGGAVITETVFAWPGMGLLAIQAIYTRDYNIVQAVVLLSAFVFLVVNLCVDLFYLVLDPRIRLE